MPYDILVYPNPAVDLVHIVFPKAGRYEITLLVSKERQDYHTESDDRKYVLNIPGLEAGIYYIRLADDRRVETKELLLRRQIWSLPEIDSIRSATGVAISRK